ncbi:hypothetical protein PR202_gb10306 [Eleusine coracana subsp. coracana]|uniref:Uncharacterized protein n=1 Tax=Eleusine coracana subsp. coracana TaxID=191504 RepID=A0AAV5EKL2_ELECO|nr:hypothetical protein PR202_gb10306 [Eleusine coracana subsp. coracana]
MVVTEWRQDPGFKVRWWVQRGLQICPTTGAMGPPGTAVGAARPPDPRGGWCGGATRSGGSVCLEREQRWRNIRPCKDVDHL